MKHLYLLLMTVLIFSYVNAQSLGTSLFDLPETTSSLSFIENKGQWKEQVQYMMKFQGGVALFEEGKIIYDFYRFPISKRTHFKGKKVRAMGFPDKTFYHAIFVKLKGANPHPKIISGGEKQEYHNYYLGNDPNKWASNVKLFEDITYKEVYPGIDMRFYGNGDVLKYDFLLKAGVDPAEISLSYEGADAIFVREGNLHIKTSLGELIEEKPLAFQWNGNKKQEVKVEFFLQNNELSFIFPEGFDKSKELLIDPVLVFATHSGATADNWGFTATYDSLGNAYGGGVEKNSLAGSSAYPDTPGAYAGSSAGSDEVAISKFSPDGSTLLYATYLGGGGVESPHSLVVNNLNQLVVFGTTSSSNFPTSLNAHDQNLGGSIDIFVSVFAETGTNLIGSTYLGGSLADGEVPSFINLWNNYGDEFRGEVITDDNNNILIGSISNSTDFPVTTGAYQTFKGGLYDGVLAELSPNCSAVNWATYIGGGADDAIYSLKKLANGNIAAVGGTSSLDLPVSANTYQGMYAGGSTDGYVCVVNASGAALLASTYVGTNDDDQLYLLDYDNAGDLYFVGQTEGTTWPIISSSSGTVVSNPGGTTTITKMPTNLQSVSLSTVVGNPPNSLGFLSGLTVPSAFLVDECGRIYFSGWGVTTNLPITPDAIQSTTDGEDFYLAVYEEDMTGLAFGTYFGGSQESEHVDGGTSRFDKKGVVYQAVCSSCFGSGTYPGTTGSYSPNSGILGCNMAVFKINLETFTIDANFEAQDTTGVALSNVGCAPLVVDFENLTTTNSGQSGFAYEWDFGLRGITSNEFEPTFVYDTAGLFTVRLIVTDTVSCRDPDTAYQQIRVYEVPTVSTSGDEFICAGDTVLLSANGPLGNLAWEANSSILDDRFQGSVQVSTQVTDSFYVQLVDTNGCADRAGLLVTVVPTGPINTYPDTISCYGLDFALDARTTWGSQYAWSSSPLLTIQNANSPSALVQNLTQDVTFQVEVTNNIGCREVASFVVTNSGDSLTNDTSICPGEAVLLSLPDGISYSWTPGSNLDDPLSQSPIATPSTSLTYRGRAQTPDGCYVFSDWEVTVHPVPRADAGPDMTICVGDSVLLVGSGDAAPIWSPSTSLDSATVFGPLAFPAQTREYSLTVTNAFGCTDSDQVQVFVNEKANIRAIEDQEVCDGESVSLSASGGLRYNWEPSTYLSSTTSPNPTASPADSLITYYVTGVDSLGCEGLDSVTLTLVSIPRTVLDWEPVCEDQSFFLSASGGENYLWSNSETRPFIYVSPTSVSTYSVVALNGDCAGNTVEVTLDPAGLFPLSAFELNVLDGFIPFDVQAINLSQNAVAYTWINPFTANYHEENPLFSIPEAGDHEITLIVESVFGCLDSSTQLLRGEDVWIQVPNAFTPNADGYNDRFFTVSYGMESLNVQIFNRWGQVVFESEQIDFQWDGNGPRGPLSEGVYVYKIQAQGKNGNTYNEVGTVTLVR